MRFGITLVFSNLCTAHFLSMRQVRKFRVALAFEFSHCVFVFGSRDLVFQVSTIPLVQLRSHRHVSNRGVLSLARVDCDLRNGIGVWITIEKNFCSIKVESEGGVFLYRLSMQIKTRWCSWGRLTIKHEPTNKGFGMVNQDPPSVSPVVPEVKV